MSAVMGREEQRKELMQHHKLTVFRGYSEFYLGKYKLHQGSLS